MDGAKLNVILDVATAERQHSYISNMQLGTCLSLCYFLDNVVTITSHLMTPIF
jgi:hypothetical protein